MNKKVIWAVLAVIVVGGGAYWLMNTDSGDQGTYAYRCANGTEFRMTPSEDMSQVMVTGGSPGMFTGTATLNHMGDGAHFEGDHNGTLIVFGGAGEEVQLTVGQETTVCNPKPNVDMAPWNWGDAGEGGGTQDLALIVSQSIVGKWQSVDDANFTREFKDDGTVFDIHNNVSAPSGTWEAFTKDKALSVSFALEANVPYIQMKVKGVEANTLNFKVSRLTPEELELVDMGRGGVLKFKKVQ